MVSDPEQRRRDHVRAVHRGFILVGVSLAIVILAIVALFAVVRSAQVQRPNITTVQLPTL